MTPDEVTAEAVALMEKSATLVLGLSEQEADYDLSYLQGKLAKCSAFQERLAEMVTRITQLQVPVLQMRDAAEAQVEAAEAEVIDAGLKDVPASLRVRYVKGKTAEPRSVFQQWSTTAEVLRAAKRAIEQRADTMKRLDSDIRLHERILEAKIGVGAMPRPGEGFGGPVRHRGEERDLTRDPEPETYPASAAGDEIDLG